MERRLAAIMAADMVGYSRLVAADEIGTITRHRAHRRDLIDPRITSHGGRIVKATGDGLLVEFQSAVGAVECAIEIQRAVAAGESREPEARRISYRIGEARVLWQEALHHNPDYSLDQKRRALPYKNPDGFDQLVNGLRKAGLPV